MDVKLNGLARQTQQTHFWTPFSEWFIRYFYEWANFLCLLGFLSNFIMCGCQIQRLSKTNATNTFLNIFFKWFIRYFHEWANFSCLLGFLSNFIMFGIKFNGSGKQMQRTHFWTPFPDGSFDMTQCKIRVNLGFTEPYKGEITVLHRRRKNQKTKNIIC